MEGKEGKGRTRDGERRKLDKEEKKKRASELFPVVEVYSSS